MAKEPISRIISTLNDTDATAPITKRSIVESDKNSFGVLRGLEAGAGITLTLADADGINSTAGKKIIIGATGTSITSLNSSSIVVDVAGLGLSNVNAASGNLALTLQNLDSAITAAAATGASANDITYTPSASAPASPKVGDIWFNTNNSSVNMRLNTGAGESWVDVTARYTPTVDYTAASAAPSSPTIGDHWFDTANGELKIFMNNGSGNTWISVSEDELVATKYTAGSTSPVGPNVGDHWLDTINDVIKVWMDDGTGFKWVDITSGTSGSGSTLNFTTASTQPASAAIGDHWYNTSNDTMYVYMNDGSADAWIDVSMKPIPANGGYSFTSNAVQPSNPDEGDYWWDSANDVLYIYVNKAGVPEWVDISTVNAQAVATVFGRTGIITAQTGDYDSSMIETLIQNGVVEGTVQEELEAIRTLLTSIATWRSSEASIVLSPSSDQPNARTLTAGNGLVLNDAGAGNNLEINVNTNSLNVLATADVNNDWIAIWDASAGELKKINVSSISTNFVAPVDSFNGRTGAIIPTTGDYTAGQVAVAPTANLVSTNVQAALQELQGDINTITAAQSSFAPLNGNYLTIGNDAALPNERAFIPGAGLKATDAGVGGNYTLAVDVSTTPIQNTGVDTINDYVLYYNNANSGTRRIAVGSLLDNVDVGTKTVFGRSDVNIVAQSGDYTASQINVSPSGNLTATNVQGALTELQGDVNTLTSDVATKAGRNEQYLVLSASGNLTGERIFQVTDGLKAVDAGANNHYTIGLDINGLSYDAAADSSDELVTYDVSLGQYRKITLGDIVSTLGSTVSSFNGRTGVVNPQTGDYNGTHITITNGNGLLATTVQGALSEHQNDINTLEIAVADAAKKDAEYIVASLTGDLDNERVLNAGVGLKQTIDANSWTIDLDLNDLSTISTIDTATDTIAIWDASINETRKAPISTLLSSLNTGVMSVFGRNTAAITAMSGDYDAVQISMTPVGNLLSDNVGGALVELQGDIDNINTALGERVQTHTSVITVNSESSITNGRRLQATGGITITDGGNGGDVTVDMNINSLTVTTPDAADELILFDVSAAGNRKVTLGDITSSIAIPVDSVFGRTGAIVAAPGDYTATQIDATPPGTLTGTNAQALINELDAKDTSLQAQVDTKANKDEQYLVLGSSSDLDNERVFTAGAGIIVNDAGAGNAFTVGVDINGVTSEATLDASDTLLFYDASAAAVRKATFNDVMTQLAPTGVSTVFGRAGANIIAQAGDYEASEIVVVPNGNLTSSDVQSALVELQNEINATITSTDAKAPRDAQYLALATHANLDNERVFAAGAGIQVNDGGAGNNFSVSIDINGLPASTGLDGAADYVAYYDTAAEAIRKATLNDVLAELTLPVTTVHGRTGDITAVAGDYTAAEVDFVAAGGLASTDVQAALVELKGMVDTANANVTAAAKKDESYLVLSTSTDLDNERVLTVTGGLTTTDGGANGNFEIALDIDSLAAEANIDAAADHLLMYDASVSANKKVTVQDVVDLVTVPVDTVFGRTGAVVAQASDYDADQIDVNPGNGMVSSNVQAALDEHQIDINALNTTVNGLATKTANYLTTSADATLDNERVLAVGTGLKTTDNGASQPFEIALDAVNLPIEASLQLADSLLFYDVDAGVEKRTEISNVLSLINVPVDSVFGRTGVITAVAGDYAADQITVTPSGNLAAAEVQSALVELQGDIDAINTALDDKASTNSHFLVIGTDSTLDNERALVANTGLSTIDGGPAGLFQIQLDYSTLVDENTLDTGTDLLAFWDASANQMRRTAIDTLINEIDIPVDSVYGRTGAVVAAAGDYDANQIDFTPTGSLVSTEVQAAIVEVQTNVDTLAGEVAKTSANSGAPTAANDSINGFDLGHVWVDETNNTAYVSVDSTSGAAVWVEIKDNAFTGSNGVSSGVAGNVPAPAATDNTKFLKGDGTWSTIVEASHYTSAETATNITFIGESVYTKVITVGSLPNATSVSIPHSITGIVSRISARGMTSAGNTLPKPASGAGTDWITLQFTNTNIVVTTGADFSAESAEIIIEYTK